jgi:ABC-type glycerol-3-phosphate transport system substrate-binding protein
MSSLRFRLLRLLPAVTLMLAAACSVFMPEGTNTPAPGTPDGGTASPQQTATETLEQEPPETPEGTQPTLDAGQLTLRIWVPPQFDPYNGTPEGELLRLRLADFATVYPGMRIEVRVKAVDGVGGLLDSLSTASAAAPDAAPDLIALGRTEMEAAALKGLLHPYEGLSAAMDGGGWFEYAQQLAHLQDSTFGIPFAGDSLLMLHDPTVTIPPARLDAILQSSMVLALPVTDPQALLTMELYLAAGGKIQDEQGRPALDAAVLEQVLSFYSQAAAINALLPQVDSTDQALRAYQEGRVDFAAVWASDAIPAVSQQGETTALAPLPTLDGKPYSLANGWVWALSSGQPERQGYAVELAEFLVEPEFLAKWTRAAGYLPVQEAALAAWDDSGERYAVEQAAKSSSLIPAVDILATLSPVLQQAALDVLSGQMDPKAAAEKAASAVQ